jgi:hypothetical protein
MRVGQCSVIYMQVRERKRRGREHRGQSGLQEGFRGKEHLSAPALIIYRNHLPVRDLVLEPCNTLFEFHPGRLQYPYNMNILMTGNRES